MKLSEYLKTTKKQKIKNVILDLDETLINSITQEELNIVNKRKKFESHSESFTYHIMDTEYVVIERPNLQKFLNYIFKNFNVSVWTAASKTYAIFVIKNVILKQGKNRKIDYVLYDEHCDISKKKTSCIKDLSQLFHIPGYTRENTLIIDDNMNVFNQSNKVINAKPFLFFSRNSETDDELNRIKKILFDLKVKKVSVNDVVL